MNDEIVKEVVSSMYTTIKEWSIGLALEELGYSSLCSEDNLNQLKECNVEYFYDDDHHQHEVVVSFPWKYDAGEFYEFERANSMVERSISEALYKLT